MFCETTDYSIIPTSWGRPARRKFAFWGSQIRQQCFAESARISYARIDGIIRLHPKKGEGYGYHHFLALSICPWLRKQRTVLLLKSRANTYTRCRSSCRQGPIDNSVSIVCAMQFIHDLRSKGYSKIITSSRKYPAYSICRVFSMAEILHERGVSSSYSCSNENFMHKW